MNDCMKNEFRVLHFTTSFLMRKLNLPGIKCLVEVGITAISKVPMKIARRLSPYPVFLFIKIHPHVFSFRGDLQVPISPKK